MTSINMIEDQEGYNLYTNKNMFSFNLDSLELISLNVMAHIQDPKVENGIGSLWWTIKRKLEQDANRKGRGFIN